MSEDSTKYKHEIWKNLLKKTLSNISGAINWSELDIAFPGDHDIILHGNKWKEKKPTGKFRSLCEFVATVALSEEEFIFWHFDSDVPWEVDFDYLQNLENSENYSSFYDKVFKMVQDFAGSSDEVKEKFKTRIIIVPPFYSIEAWLYTAYEALRLEGDEDSASSIEALLDGHDSFDLVDKIKHLTSVKDKKNLFLSEKISTEKLKEYKMSFFNFFEAVKSNKEFIEKIPTY